MLCRPAGSDRHANLRAVRPWRGGSAGDAAGGVHNPWRPGRFGVAGRDIAAEPAQKITNLLVDDDASPEVDGRGLHTRGAVPSVLRARARSRFRVARRQPRGGGPRAGGGRDGGGVRRERCRRSAADGPASRLEPCVRRVQLCARGVQHCLRDVQHCLRGVQHCLRDVQDCSRDVEHCARSVQGCLRDVQHCARDVQHCLRSVQDCLRDVKHCARGVQHCLRHVHNAQHRVRGACGHVRRPRRGRFDRTRAVHGPWGRCYHA
jgi:hypothetical protein